MTDSTDFTKKPAWNKGKLVGQKIPFKLEDILGIRIRLEIADNVRELALFNLVIDSNLRTSDLVNLKVFDVSHGSKVQSRAMLITRQYARIVERWVKSLGIDPLSYGTHTLRRTKASLIQKRTKKSKSDSVTVRP